MAQIKALAVDWFAAGFAIGHELERMPPSPPGLLASFETWPLDERAKKAIEALQDAIAIHLEYRVFVAHRVKLKVRAGGEKQMISFSVRTPKELLSRYAFLQKLGVKLTPGELAALNVHAMLGRILIEHFVSPEWKWQIPVMVAAISNSSASQAATVKAERPRQRSNELRDAKREARKNDPYAPWKNLLDILEGDGGPVVSWDDDHIEWTTDAGEHKTTMTSTFRNWK